MKEITILNAAGGMMVGGLCDEFKDVIRQKDRQLKSTSAKALVLGKIVAESYGVIKIIDNTLNSLESNLESVIMIKKLVILMT